METLQNDFQIHRPINDPRRAVFSLPAPDGLLVRRVGTQPVDPVSIPGGARHFQCVNDIGVSVLFLV